MDETNNKLGYRDRKVAVSIYWNMKTLFALMPGHTSVIETVVCISKSFDGTDVCLFDTASVSFKKKHSLFFLFQVAQDGTLDAVLDDLRKNPYLKPAKPKRPTVNKKPVIPATSATEAVMFTS